MPAPGSGACRQCGRVQPDRVSYDRPGTDGCCRQCHAEPPGYERAWAVAAYRASARALIHLLKYEGMKPVAGYWAERLAIEVKDEVAAADVVAPVPLSRRRQRERGFNQSAEIGRRLAHRLGCGYAEHALERQRDTAVQAGLDAAARERNLARAFGPGRDRVAGRRVWLVDDVLTTGATARAAASALREAGAAGVRLLTAARADLEMEPERGWAA
ncbi:MAG TPA: phosphoribosyltransferase family protein [Terriglobales bacterium]|nr:phosphoribosyltransferase family protein [Terriglobales bacterium]